MIQRQSKYKSVKTVIDGIKFDSKLESNCYKIIKEHGMLPGTELQRSFELQPKFRDHLNKPIRPITYKCDFYIDNHYVIDAKGMLLTDFKMKRKMLLYKYGVYIICVSSMKKMDDVCVRMKLKQHPAEIIDAIKPIKKVKK